MRRLGDGGAWSVDDKEVEEVSKSKGDSFDDELFGEGRCVAG